MVDESEERKGFWGATLSKLKFALSKTKTQISGSIEGEEQGETESATTPSQPESYAQDESSSSRPEASVAEVRTYAEQEDLSEQQSAYSEQQAKYIEQQSHYAEDLGEQPVLEPSNSVAVAAAVKDAPQVVPEPLVHSTTIDEEYLEDLEEKLIKSDIGLSNVQTLITHMRKESRGKSWTTRELVGFLKKEFQSILKSAPSAELKFVPGKVNIYLVVGVNGTGKTTSIGKLSWRFKQEGKRVLMAAGDTFRAAAESQLEIWSERAGVDIVRLGENADPGAVVFTAIDRAKKENYDCLVFDTAGRLHNKTNLMAELAKIRGVVEKHGQGLPLECLLVLDASTGQNGLQQAKLFTEVCKLTGVILTKLDGTAKGGVVFSIARDLKIPVKLIGLGEGMDDLRDFEPELFVEALF
jgi:fused signal recognition particle receptor